MPSTSAKQARVMSAIAHGWRPSNLHIPVKVAKEFHAADKGKKWGAKAGGGSVDKEDRGSTIRERAHKFLRGVMSSGAYPIESEVERVKNAYEEARKATGADRTDMASGGFLSPPWYERVAGRQMRQNQFSGFVNSSVPGRTDRHRVGVGAGAYIVPADTVSAIGQNNSMAGASILKKMFGMGSRFGVRPIRAKTPGFAAGGDVDDGSVPIVIAGGEFAIPPEVVTKLGGGDLDKGHKILDAWVMDIRKKHIKTLRSLPRPKK